jgi:hypothetical protein
LSKTTCRHKQAAFLLWVAFVAPLRAQETAPYFQQSLDYEIHVSLDDQAHFLRGNEKIAYTNHAPQALDVVYMHIWPNAYSDLQSAFGRQKRDDGSTKFSDSKPEQRGFIDSLTFTVDGQAVTHAPWNGNPDIIVLNLTKPIPAGATVEISTPFRVKLPDSFSRLGHIGQQYQLCQWYPKPAVFDRKGWHPMPYLDQGEFYSDFGTFDVYIDVPKNYVVGATGDLPANDPEWAWIKAREAQSRILLDKPLTEARFVPEFPERERKTLHFHQENVHDFAWFCDKNYYVLADTVTLPASGRSVRCVAMFTNLDRDLWRQGPEYVAKAIYYYSKWNGDYPYAHATAVDGALSAGAGMEYPNITVLGAGGSASNLEMVTMHEVGHNWYYGILGSNERDYPWMDEGLNTYFEGKYWQVVHGDSMDMIPAPLQQALGINFTHTLMAETGYGLAAGQGIDQPVELHAADYSSLNYGVIAYMKTGLVFNYLEAYLGAEVTDRCFHTYYERWKFKHPYPDDIQAVFEEVSGKDLDWFFDHYLVGTEKLDFRIAGIKGDQITLRNRSALALPAAVSLMDKEGKIVQTYWTEPFTGTTTLTVPTSDFHQARVNADGVIPELRPENNSMRAKGLLRHAKPLALNFGYKYPDPTKANLNFLPALGYNTTDGFQAGILLYSSPFPKRKYEFHVMPMFGFQSSEVTGSAGFTARWQPSKRFATIDYKLRASSFANILRIKNALNFNFKPEGERSPWRHSVHLASQILATRSEGYDLGPSDWYLPVFGTAAWQLKYNRHANAVQTRVELGGNTAQRMGRASVEADITHKLSKKSALYARAFAGFLLANEPQPYLLQYRVSGSGDPFGESILIDRAQVANSVFARQVIRDHGSFSSIVDGSFDKGLLAFNAHWKTPIPLFSVFGDVAYGMGNLGNATFYGAGLRLNFLKEAVMINFPVLGSNFGGLPGSGADFFRGVNFCVDPMRLTDLLGNMIQGAN